MHRFAHDRERMVARTIAGRGVTDPAVLGALVSVPRHLFVPEHLAGLAYRDTPLPLGEGQTISQPYVVALMAQALRLTPEARLLEIGTGSGYSAAIASRLCAEVFTVERHASLASQAEQTLRAQEFFNVHVRQGDGTLGWPEHAPYDAIVATASGPHVPPALLHQLAIGGRLVMPVGSEHDAQQLVRLTRTAAGVLEREELGSVRFVPLIGAEGWSAAAGPAP